MTDLAQRLQTLGAHNDVVQWASGFGGDALAAFEGCSRADWLLGVGARLGAERKALVRAALSCAREAMTYLPDEAPQLSAALDAVDAWTRGQLSDDAVAAQARAVEALPAPTDAVADAVAQAVVATLAAVREPEAAAHAAACTIHAAVIAAGECAMESALRYTHERCANLVRKELTAQTLASLLDGAR